MKSSVKLMILSIGFAVTLTAATANNEKISLSLDGMGVSDLIKLVAATTNKNIFIGEEIPGTISYAGNKPIHKKDLFAILQSTLDARGYTLIDTGGGYLSVVKSADVTQMNLPLMEKSDIPQMQTHIFTFRFAPSEPMAAKFKHFTSKNGKITSSKESN
jgi:type II secretory pathway component GspD/PulD (secretin)